MKCFTTILMLLAALGADAAEKSGRLEGTIVGRDASKNQLTVAHGDVAGLMSAMTASVAYSTAAWNTSLIFGSNDRSEGRTTSAFVAESVFKFGGVTYLTDRGEIVDKDELIADEIVRVKALTMGYSRDVFAMTAVGANLTRYSILATIKPLYGGNPRSFYLFVRFRGGGA